jgi:hypothetical protein
MPNVRFTNITTLNLPGPSHVSIHQLIKHLNFHAANIPLLSSDYPQHNVPRTVTMLTAGRSGVWIRVGSDLLRIPNVRPALGHTLPPAQWVLGSLPHVDTAAGGGTTSHHLVPRLSTSTAITLSPSMPSWRGKDNLTFIFIFSMRRNVKTVLSEKLVTIHVACMQQYTDTALMQLTALVHNYRSYSILQFLPVKNFHGFVLIHTSVLSTNRPWNKLLGR